MSQQPLPDSDVATDVLSRRRLSIIFWLLLAFSLFAIAGGVWWWVVDGGSGAGETSPPKAVSPVPAVDFQLADLTGRQVRLSDLRGQVVLLNFWATWCPPCKAEMPDLEALYRAYGKPRNFTVIGVDVEESPETVAAFARQLGLTFPLLPDTEGKVSDYRYFVRSLPTSYIIDREGKVRYTWTGQQSRSSMLSRLESVW